MYAMKFLDGSPVPPEYEQAVSRLVSDACDAEETLGIETLDTPQARREKE